MDEITQLLDEAASHLQPSEFDVEGLVARTRVARRRRHTLQVASSSLGVAVVVGASFGAAATLGTRHTATPGGIATATALVPHPAPATVAPVVTLRTEPPNLHAPRSTPIPTLPKGFAPACGNPGSKLLVRIVPVTIPHRICDLSGVEIDRPGQVTAVVPPRGKAVAVTPAGPAGPAKGLSITTDKKSGDVTISAP